MTSFIREKSKSRTITALIFMFISIAITIGIVLEPQFRERPNIIAVGLGCLSIVSTFGFMFYAVIYSISDALSIYEFLPDKVILHRTTNRGQITTVHYSKIFGIKVNTPIWGNFPRDYYANLKILTADKIVELEAINDWEEVVLYLFEQTSNVTDIPIEQLFTDELTALIYRQISERQKLKS